MILVQFALKNVAWFGYYSYLLLHYLCNGCIVNLHKYYSITDMIC